MWWRHFIYNASFTLLLKLMRFQIIQNEQHLNCYLVWKRALPEIRESDRYPLWHDMPSVDSRSFGKAIRRNVVVKRTLDRRRGLHESEGLWLVVGSVASVGFAQWGFRSLPYWQTGKTVEILSWHYNLTTLLGAGEHQEF